MKTFLLKRFKLLKRVCLYLYLSELMADALSNATDLNNWWGSSDNWSYANLMASESYMNSIKFLWEKRAFSFDAWSATWANIFGCRMILYGFTCGSNRKITITIIFYYSGSYYLCKLLGWREEGVCDNIWNIFRLFSYLFGLDLPMTWLSLRFNLYMIA